MSDREASLVDLAQPQAVAMPYADGHWRDAGADGAVILARSPENVDAIVAAIERW